MGLNDAPLAKGLEGAKQRLSTFAGALGALGGALALGFATNKIVGWVRSFADAGNELFLLARAAQISIPEMAELKKVTQALGLDLEGTVGAMRKMGIFLEKFRTGGIEAREAMAQLGITMADLVGLSEPDKLALIGERLAAIGNTNTRQALGAAIFGKGGAEITGAGGQIAGALATARESGPVNADDILKARELTLALNALERAKKSVFRIIGASLAPAFTAAANAITGVIKQVRVWVDANREVFQKIALIGGIVVGVSAALFAVAAVVKAVLFTAGGIWAVMAGIAVVAKLTVFWLLWTFTTWGLIYQVVKLVGLAILRATGAIDAMARGMARVGAVFNEAFAGIKDAIEGGDLELAWAIAIAGMQVLWVDFNLWMRSTTGATFIDIFAGLKSGWAEAIAFIRSSWAILQSEIRSSAWSLVDTFPSLFAGNAMVAAGSLSRPSPAAAAATLTRQLARIEADRLAALARANTGQIAGNAGLDAEHAQNRLNQLNEAALMAREAAEARRTAGLAPVAEGLGELGSGGSARSTFNRDVLWGFGSSPVTKLVDNTNRMIELLMPLERIEETLEENLRVGVS